VAPRQYARCLPRVQRWNEKQQFAWGAHGNLVARNTLCGFLRFEVGCIVPHAWSGDITPVNTQIEAAVANNRLGDTLPALMPASKLAGGLQDHRLLIEAVITGHPPGGMSSQDFRYTLPFVFG
jgi:hypothetical protein